MVQDSFQLITPFMRAGTYPARDYATLELSGLELSFTGACTPSWTNIFRNRSSPEVINLPALDRPRPLYLPYLGLQGPVF